MNNDDIFGKKLFKNLKPYLKKPLTKQERKSFQRNIIYSLHGQTNRVTPIGEKIKPIEEFLRDILYNYSELEESRKRFDIISVLIRQYPTLPSWEKVGITKTTYLRYHFEAFLNEAYVYRERMLLLLGGLKRKCKEKSLFREMKKIDEILNEFKIAISSISLVRDRHVHIRRYTDSKIDQLASLELFKEIEYFKELKEREYKKLRIDLSNDIRKFSADLEKLQNITLEKITQLTFSELRKKYV